MKKALVFCATFLTTLVIANPVGAHYKPGTKHNIRHAINKYWCGNTNKYCEAGRQAWKVAGCETGNTYSVWARNGQYLGLFQMGSSERRIYGHGWNAWEQAKAAHKYYVASGRDWSPWTCRWAAY